MPPQRWQVFSPTLHLQDNTLYLVFTGYTKLHTAREAMNKVHGAEDPTLIVAPFYLFKTMGGIFIRFPFFAATGALDVFVFADLHLSPPLEPPLPDRCKGATSNLPAAGARYIILHQGASI